MSTAYHLRPRRRAFSKLAASTALLLLTIAPAALAAPTFYTSRAAFAAASGSLTTESLDVITPGGNVTVQPTGVTLTGGGTANFANEGPGIFTSEGASSLRTKDWTVGDTMTFTFAGSIVGMGFDFLDNTPPFDMNLTVNGASFNYTSNVIQAMGGAGPLFMGVRDAGSPFTTVTLTTNADNFIVNFDFIQFEAAPTPGGGGNNVPLPLAAWAGLALGGVIVTRRAKKLA